MFKMAEKINNLKLKSKTYSARFLEAGVVRYGDEMVLIRNENLMNIAYSFKGIPVIIGHQNLDNENIENLAVGYISKVYMESDGWAWCDFNITNEKAKNLIENGYSVSCAYIPTKTGTGGIYHNISYGEEIIEGKAMHIALVSNPRYEDALIIENSLKEKKKMKIFKFGKKEEVKNSAEEIQEEELQNSFIDIDGEKVPVSKLIEVYNEVQESKKEKLLDANDEIIINDNGDKVKVSELVNAYKEKDKMKKTKEEEDTEEEKKKMMAKKKEEKKNSNEDSEKDFNELKNARTKAEVENSKKAVETYKSSAEKYKEGEKRYGSPQVINQK